MPCVWRFPLPPSSCYLTRSPIRASKPCKLERKALVVNGHSRIAPLLIFAALTSGATSHLGAELRRSPHAMWPAKQPLLIRDLQLSAAPSRQGISLVGTCRPEKIVIVSAAGLQQALPIQCENGRFQTHLPQLGPGNTSISANQINSDGSISYGFVDLNPNASTAARSIALTRLAPALSYAKPGTILKLLPGRYEGLRLTINQSGTPDHPIVIDGGDHVTLSGATQIDIRGDWVTLRRITFENSGRYTIQLNGRGDKLFNASFRKCGADVHAACVAVYGQNAEVAFTDFIASRSVSLQIRGDERRIPRHAYVHHNRFLNIPRLSDNGQEPIQVAAKGGTTTDDRYFSRIDSNIFYKTDGDIEAISLKSSYNYVVGNVFKSMSASPNLRGGYNNTISYNFLYDVLPLRIFGKNHQILSNIFQCPRGNYFIEVNDEYPGHEATIASRIADNLFLTNGHDAIRYRQGKFPGTLAVGTTVERNVVQGPGSLLNIYNIDRFKYRNYISEKSESKLIYHTTCPASEAVGDN